MVTAESIVSLQNIIQELTEYTHKSARQNQLITQADEEWLASIGISAPGYTPGTAGNETLLQTAAIRMAERTQTQDSTEQQSNLNVAGLLGVDRIVLNALGNAYRAAVTPSPYEHFAGFFEDGLQSPRTRDDFIDALAAARTDMVISIVQTMHPTIYHTAFAREKETELTKTLEAIVDKLKEQDPGNRTIDSKLLGKAKDTIDALVKGVRDSKTLTPDKRVTIAEENVLDRENHWEMKKNFDLVIEEYNKALSNVLANPAALELNPEQVKKLEASKIDLSVHNPMEYRTWAYASDSDGRDKATSLELYRGIYRQAKEGDTVYKSRKRDPRANAKDEIDTVSCLIQRAYKNDYKDNDEDTEHGHFRKFCEDFVSERNEAHTGPRNGWQSPEKSILQQLTEDEQAEFLRRIIANEHELDGKLYLVPPSVKTGTIAFNKMFAETYSQFLRDNNLDPYTELESLKYMRLRQKDQPPNYLMKLSNVIKDKKVSVGGKKVRFNLDRDSLTYERDKFYEASGLFDGCRILEGDKQVPLTREEHRKLLDVVKRLQVLNHAIDEFDGAVADRYQIAEFKGAADFYATMLLFKETEIITVENGLVVGKPKLSIQPLLETAEDQAAAPEKFRKLLEDPLVKSYYQALGKADVMFGYSDGSKSAGNLASEWSIRQNAARLQEVFAEAGVKLQVFHGRGRGDSRGGQFAEGQNQRMTAPSLAADMRNDVTMQSDLPLQMAISPSFGRDTCASIIAGTITAKKEATREMRKMQDPDYKERIEKLESVIDGIAKKSEEVYRELVLRRPETTTLLEAIHDNPLRSSREPKRVNTEGQKTPEPGKEAAEKLEKTRAITLEYGLVMVDAPLGYIGMKTALQDFIDSGSKITDSNGNEHTGLVALKVLYETHPFFRGMMDKTVQGLHDYDPDVFKQYARFAGVEKWAADCINELSGDPLKSQKGLYDLVQSIRDVRQQQRREAPEDTIRNILDRSGSDAREAAYRVRELDLLENRSAALDKTTHALALSLTVENGRPRSAKELGGNPFKPNREHYPLKAKLIDLIAFVAQATHPENELYPAANTLREVDSYRAL